MLVPSKPRSLNTATDVASTDSRSWPGGRAAGRDGGHRLGAQWWLRPRNSATTSSPRRTVTS